MKEKAITIIQNITNKIFYLWTIIFIGFIIYSVYVVSKECIIHSYIHIIDFVFFAYAFLFFGLIFVFLFSINDFAKKLLKKSFIKNLLSTIWHCCYYSIYIFAFSFFTILGLNKEKLSLFDIIMFESIIFLILLGLFLTIKFISYIVSDK